LLGFVIAVTIFALVTVPQLIPFIVVAADRTIGHVRWARKWVIVDTLECGLPQRAAIQPHGSHEPDEMREECLAEHPEGTLLADQGQSVVPTHHAPRTPHDARKTRA
jgi:hypothetical protein